MLIELAVGVERLEKVGVIDVYFPGIDSHDRTVLCMHLFDSRPKSSLAWTVPVYPSIGQRMFDVV